MGALAVGLLLLGGVFAAWATPLGQRAPGCLPAYATLEPDGYGSSDLEVRVVDTQRGTLRFRWVYVHASAPCCEWTRLVLTEVLRQVQDPTARVIVGVCR